MKKSVIKCGLMVFASTLLVACADMSEQINEALGNTSMRFGTGVMSKSTITDMNFHGSTFAAFAVKSKDGLYEVVMDNQKVQYNGTTWGYSPVRYWDKQASYFFIAYAPYFPPESVAPAYKNYTIENFSIFDANGKIENQSDLLVSNPVNRAQGDISVVNLTFAHVLSNININVKINNEWGSQVTLTSFKMSGMKTKGTYSFLEAPNEWKTSGLDYAGSEITATGLPKVITQTTTPLLTNLLMIPQPMTTNIKIDLTFSAAGVPTPYTKQILLVNKGLESWKKDERVTYTLIIAPNNIHFEKPTVQKWGSVTQGGVVVII